MVGLPARMWPAAATRVRSATPAWRGMKTVLLAVSLSLAAGALVACGPPPVSARVIWVDAGRTLDGALTLHQYVDGAQETIAFRGELTDATPVLGLDPSGRLAVVRGVNDSAVILDLDDGRALPVRVPPVDLTQRPPLTFTQDGAALFWSEGDELVVLDLRPGAPVPRGEDGTLLPTRTAGLAGLALAAPRARRHVVIDGRALSLQALTPGGLRSTEDSPEDTSATLAPVELARVELDLPALFEAPVTFCPEVATGCRSRLAIEPEGRAVAIVQNDIGCPILVWRPNLDEALETPPELTCVPAYGDGSLLAMTDEDQLLINATTRLFVVDLDALAADPTNYTPAIVPTLGRAPLQWTWSFTEDDPRLVFLSLEGPMYTWTASPPPAAANGAEGGEAIGGYDVVNVERALCPPIEGRSAVISANGRNAAWACEVEADVTASTIVRVEAGRIATYTGIAMNPLAIDDDGDLLLASEERVSDDPQGAEPSVIPRALYTLDATGTLHRLDPLEPSPIPFLDLTTYGRAKYFDASGR